MFGSKSLRMISECDGVLVKFAHEMMNILNSLNYEIKMFRMSGVPETEWETQSDLIKSLGIKDFSVIPKDLSVLCGHRTEIEQNKAFDLGNSRVQWPKGKHNKIPSEAIDIVPYPLDWGRIDQFEFLGVLGTYIISLNDTLSSISWGGNWKKFKDYPHWEKK